MASKIVMNSLITLFEDEISNPVLYQDKTLIVKLKDGSMVKILTKNIA